MKKSLRLLAIAATISLAGCGAGWGVSYYATTPPPPLQAEAFGVAPGPGYVWTNGYWGWTGGRYNWVPGRWARPPRGHQHWEQARWERHGDRYEFHKGHWR